MVFRWSYAVPKLKKYDVNIYNKTSLKWIILPKKQNTTGHTNNPTYINIYNTNSN